MVYTVKHTYKEPTGENFCTNNEHLRRFSALFSSNTHRNWFIPRDRPTTLNLCSVRSCSSSGSALSSVASSSSGDSDNCDIAASGGGDVLLETQGDATILADGTVDDFVTVNASASSE